MKEVQLANIQKQKSQEKEKPINFKEELEKMNEAKQKSEGHFSNSQEYQWKDGHFSKVNKQNSGNATVSPYDNQPKLTPAQIQNRKFSILIKNFSIVSDQKFSDETEVLKN